MRELTKEQIEQVAGAGSTWSSYGSSYDPSYGHKHKKHHDHHKHHSSYDPKPAPYSSYSTSSYSTAPYSAY